MRKLGLFVLLSLTIASLSPDVSAQRGRSGGRGGSSYSQGAGGSKASSRSRGSSRGATRSAGRSMGRSSGGSSRSFSRPSRGSSRVTSSRPSSAPRTSSSRGATVRSSSSRPTVRRSASSSSSTVRYLPRSPVRGTRSTTSSTPVDSARSPNPGRRVQTRYDRVGRGGSGTERRGPSAGVLDLREGRSLRTRFPAPYRSGRSGEPTPSTRKRSSDTTAEIRRMVDRYGRSPAAGSAERSGRRSSLPRHVLDRTDGGRGGGSTLDRSGRGGPKVHRRATAKSPSSRREARRSRGPGGVTRTDGGAGSRRDKPTRIRQQPPRSASPGSVRAARGLTKLALDDPKAARRISNAGTTLARAHRFGLSVAAGAIAGPAAGNLLSPRRSPSLVKGLGLYGRGYGYGYGYGYGGYPFGYGYGYSGCFWYPYWTCHWYPYWCYGYYYRHHFYYPFFFSSIVYHHDYYDDDDGDTIIYVNSSEPAQEYVGEGVVAAETVATAPPGERRSSSITTAAERYLKLGDDAFRGGRYADAVQFYAKAVELSPGEGVLHLVLADALFATGDYHYAAFSIRRAFELDPALVDAVVDKHEFYDDPQEFDRHLARLEVFLESQPSDQDAQLVLATNYLFGNRPAAAVDLLEAAPASLLASDEASALILASARKVQHGS